MLPILHLNGYKINNPTVLARIPQEELEPLLRGYGYEPHYVEGDDPPSCTSSWPRLWTSAWRNSGHPVDARENGFNQRRDGP